MNQKLKLNFIALNETVLNNMKNEIIDEIYSKFKNFMWFIIKLIFLL